MNDIYKRLLQIVEYKGFKSVNDFAKSGLNYASSEKLNRLKKENTTPSFEIISDITNRFEDININWFVSGRGEMTIIQSSLNEPAPSYGHDQVDRLLQTKDKLIGVLENDITELRKDKEFFRDLLKSKIINH